MEDVKLLLSSMAHESLSVEDLFAAEIIDVGETRAAFSYFLFGDGFDDFVVFDCSLSDKVFKVFIPSISYNWLRLVKCCCNVLVNGQDVLVFVDGLF